MSSVFLASADTYKYGLLSLEKPTNGLDSSLALDFVHMMREFTRQQGCSTAMGFYWGSNSKVPLFDNVLVINSYL